MQIPHQSLPPDLISYVSDMSSQLGIDLSYDEAVDLAREVIAVEHQSTLDLPLTECQLMALHSEAFEVYFGGIAGCGKTHLLLKAAGTEHKDAIIFRRKYTTLKSIVRKSRQMYAHTGASFNGSDLVWNGLPGDRYLQFGACQYEADLENFRGAEYDFVGFDEVATFTEDLYLGLTAWLRSTDNKQRSRILAAGNPPLSPEYYWVRNHWAAWLDPKHPNKAEPGEIRWYARLDDKDVEVDGPEVIKHKGEDITPLSRTFIPGVMLDELKGTGYEANLQRQPEPIRSQLLYGDFTLTEDDQTLQVIPTAHVRLAQDRWEQMTKPDAVLTAVGVDVARGGKDQTIISKRYGNWFDELLKYDGVETKTGSDVVALVVGCLAENEHKAHLVVDLTGVGSSPYDKLMDLGYYVTGFMGSSKSNFTDAGGNLEFANRRAEAWWTFREALNPESELNLALPPDPQLLADLTAPTWRLEAGVIHLEKKENLIKRLGRSPDCGDAVVMNYNYDVHANTQYF